MSFPLLLVVTIIYAVCALDEFTEDRAAQACTLLALNATAAAHALRRVGTKESRQHAKEAAGAARIARQWAKELRRKG